MKFLNEELLKLSKSESGYFCNNVNDITDALLQSIIEKILENSKGWKNLQKIEWKNNIQNKSSGYEKNIKESKLIIKNWIELKIKKENQIRDKSEIKEIIWKLLRKNKNRRVRTKDIAHELEKLKNKQYSKDYKNWIPTRSAVYQVIQELRKELRNKGFKEGYIISKSILDAHSDKVDGWEFTTNKKLIESYLDKEIEQYQKAIDHFNSYKNTLNSEK